MVLRMLWYSFKSSMEMWQHFKDFSISWSNVRQWELAVNIIPWIHLKWYAWSWQNYHCISKIDGIDRLLRRREPTLIDLANFAEDEIILVNDPLYSKQAVSQYLEKGPTRQRQRGGRKNSIQWPPKQTIHQKVYKREKLSNERTCPVCCEKHDIEDCKYYMQHKLGERSKLILQKKLCYGCCKKSKRTRMQWIVSREDFVKCAMGNIQSHSMAMSERKLSIFNISATVRQVRKEKMAKWQHVYHYHWILFWR